MRARNLHCIFLARRSEQGVRSPNGVSEGSGGAPRASRRRFRPSESVEMGGRCGRSQERPDLSTAFREAEAEATTLEADLKCSLLRPKRLPRPRS